MTEEKKDNREKIEDSSQNKNELVSIKYKLPQYIINCCLPCPIETSHPPR